MAGQAVRAVVLCASLAIGLMAQMTVGVIRSGPIPTPQEVGALEARVLQNPDDLDAERRLLEIYAVPPGRYDPAWQSLRLQRILYMVQHHPEAAVSGSRAAYIYRANRPDANSADHDAVRHAWLDAVQVHPKDTSVVLNAVRFLAVEDAPDAEQVLRRAMEDEPDNRELAANLGFVYATEILKRDSAARAAAELQQTSNAILLAAAGTALPNLAGKAVGPPADPKIFDFAAELSTRARQLAPNDADIQGPMPFIKYFVAAEDGLRAIAPVTLPGPVPSSGIHIGETVQSANLIRRTQPQYPEEARNARIIGEVRFGILIGRDGTIQNIQLISGHPLLVQAAKQAVQQWLYKPTLLNGAPVEVGTTVTVSFPPIDH